MKISPEAAPLGLVGTGVCEIVLVGVIALIGRSTELKLDADDRVALVAKERLDVLLDDLELHEAGVVDELEGGGAIGHVRLSLVQGRS